MRGVCTGAGCVCTGAVVKEKGKSLCVESKPIRVVWELLKLDVVEFHSV